MPLDIQGAIAGYIGELAQREGGLNTLFGRMDDILRRRGDQLSRIGHGVMQLVMDTLSATRGLQAGIPSVQVTNLGFLELMGAGQFAFLVLIFLKLHDCYRQQLRATNLLVQIRNQMVQLSRSSTIQVNTFNQQITRLDARLQINNQLLLELSVAVTAIANLVVGLSLQLSLAIRLLVEIRALLAAILVQLQAGLTLSGTLTFNINISTGLGGLDLGDLLGLALKALLLAAALGALGVAILGLSAALAVLSGAVALLSLALELLPENITEVIDALTRLFLSMSLFAVTVTLLLGAVAVLGILIGAVAMTDPKTLLLIAAGFAGIAAFLYAVVWTLSQFNEQAERAVPALAELFVHVTRLAMTIKRLSKDQLIKIGLGFLGIALFIGLLGYALGRFNAETLRAVPGLQSLFDGLIALARAIAGFSDAQLLRIGAGFLGVALFIGLLGYALNQFNAETLNALPALQGLFDALVNLAQAIAGFSDEQLIRIGLGLLGIVLFVGLLGLALTEALPGFQQAGPALSQLIESLNGFTQTVAALDTGNLIAMGVALAMIAAFVFAVGAALNFAVPGLTALSGVLSQVVALLNAAAAAARGMAAAVRSIPGGGGVGLSIPGFQGGGVMPHTGLAMLHAGERVLTPEQTQALGSPEPQPLPVGGYGGGGSVDQSVTIQGGITINIQAERLEADAARLLSDEIVQQLQERLGSLHTEQQFRTGTRVRAGD